MTVPYPPDFVEPPPEIISRIAEEMRRGQKVERTVDDDIAAIEYRARQRVADEDARQRRQEIEEQTRRDEAARQREIERQAAAERKAALKKRIEERGKTYTPLLRSSPAKGPDKLAQIREGQTRLAQQIAFERTARGYDEKARWLNDLVNVVFGN